MPSRGRSVRNRLLSMLCLTPTGFPKTRKGGLVLRPEEARKTKRRLGNVLQTCHYPRREGNVEQESLLVFLDGESRETQVPQIDAARIAHVDEERIYAIEIVVCRSVCAVWANGICEMWRFRKIRSCHEAVGLQAARENLLGVAIAIYFRFDRLRLRSGRRLWDWLPAVTESKS